MNEDRNFDDLAEKFQQKIYGSMKGQVRLAVLRRDLEEAEPRLCASEPLRILDAGGGQGQLSLHYAEMGHQVTLCDISINMLDLAKEAATASGLLHRITFIHDSIQNLLQHDLEHFDLIFSHALLEWVVQPQSVMVALRRHLKTDGLISTAFYNHSGVLFRNLARGNLFKVSRKDWQGDIGGLTPSNPPTIEAVEAWHRAAGLQITGHSGIRVFSDFLTPQKLEQISQEDIIAQEIACAHHPDLWRMARYIHFLSTKKNI